MLALAFSCGVGGGAHDRARQLTPAHQRLQCLDDRRGSLQVTRMATESLNNGHIHGIGSKRSQRFMQRLDEQKESSPIIHTTTVLAKDKS